MFDRISPIGPDYKTGQFGNLSNGVGVHLSETTFGFLGELAAFADALEKVEKLVALISKSDGVTAFKIASNRWFIAGPATLSDAIKSKLKPADGSLVDLTHGRASLLIVGAKAERVLSKLYAIDFSLVAFPVDTGIATSHHNIFTQIYRPYPQTFDLFIFRSFARPFWHTLQRAAEEVGYEVE
ncbi:MAG: sarcosine oxidase subunit gamma family protein [Rhizobiaceae bacterium]